MEIKEAIDVLKEGLELIEKYHREELVEYSEVLKLAVSALEKQITKTPDYEGDGYSDGKLVYDTWICPNCGEHYEIWYEDYDYCPNCGQHIKRED